MILKELPVSAKVREKKSGLVFLVAAHNHIAYNGTLLVTDAAVKIAAFDAAEPANPDAEIRVNGNNFYPGSNIHAWLNSAEESWYAPSHDDDAPPSQENISLGTVEFFDVPFYSYESKISGDWSYDKEPGFLTWFSEAFVEKIIQVDVPCHYEPKPGEVFIGPPHPIELRSKVFLPSVPEMGFEKQMNGVEGFRFRLFNDARYRVVAPTNSVLRKPEDYIYDDCSFFYWLRTPVPGSKSKCWVWASEHKLTDQNGSSLAPVPVNVVCGVRPALNLDSAVGISVPDENGIYDLLLGGE